MVRALADRAFMNNEINNILRKALGNPCSLDSVAPVSGGCINNAFRVALVDRRRFFLKTNGIELASMFHAEASGLTALAKSGVARVPEPILAGTEGQLSFLLLEWIEPGPADRNSSSLLGEMLAKLHLFRDSSLFGFDHDNFLGSTPQSNHWSKDWAEFFVSQRLMPQFQLAKDQGFNFPTSGKESFWKRIRQVLSIESPPALLHGDLWSGNYMIDSKGFPYLIDPAPYWGHAEADFGILTMFGGFDSDFFESYRNIIPEEEGSDYRLKIYQLYHYLNHLNLFGTSYLRNCQEIIQQF